MNNKKIAAKLEHYWLTDRDFRNEIYSIAELGSAEWIYFTRSGNAEKFDFLFKGKGAFADLIPNNYHLSVAYNMHSFLNGFFFPRRKYFFPNNIFFNLGKKLGEDGKITEIYRQFLNNENILLDQQYSTGLQTFISDLEYFDFQKNIEKLLRDSA